MFGEYEPGCILRSYQQLRGSFARLIGMCYHTSANTHSHRERGSRRAWRHLSHVVNICTLLYSREESSAPIPVVATCTLLGNLCQNLATIAGCMHDSFTGTAESRAIGTSRPCRPRRVTMYYHQIATLNLTPKACRVTMAEVLRAIYASIL